MALLTHQQIRDLANIVWDEFGFLTSDELNDSIGLLLEDIAGFELTSEREIRQVINQTRRIYYEIAEQKNRTR